MQKLTPYQKKINRNITLKKYREKNKEKIKIILKRYREKNKEKINEINYRSRKKARAILENKMYEENMKILRDDKERADG
jgi:hypothetical protein